MINVEVETGILTLTMHRDEKGNALTRLMLEEMDNALVQAEAKGLRGVILTGAGDAFSTGADPDERRGDVHIEAVWERVGARMAALPCLSVAAFNGVAAGRALGLALACDIRLACPEAVLSYPLLEEGGLPQLADLKRLSSLIGPARSKMMLLAVADVPAEEARVWGVVDRIASRADLVTAARALMDAPRRAKTPDGLALLKRLVAQV